MQVSESEIFLPFGRQHALPHGNIRQYTVGIISSGAGVILLVFHIELLVAFALIAAGILILISSLVIAWSRKGVSRQFVRINHEGVLFASVLPTMIQWGDISTVALFTWTYLGRPIRVVGFVPRDPEAMSARIIEQRAKTVFSRLLLKTRLRIYRRTLAPSPLMISQVVSPIRLDALLAMAQERFANELRENHVAVLGWQEIGSRDERSQ